MKPVRLNNNERALLEVEERFYNILDAGAEAGVYAYHALGSTFVLPEERRFTNLEQIQRYVDDALETPFFGIMSRELGRIPTIKVKASAYDNRASHHNGTISIPDNVEWRRELVVLHELSHHFGGQGHGKRYLESYFKIISEMMNPQLSLLMSAELDKKMRSE